MSSINALQVAVEMAERKRDAARQTLQSVQGARQGAQAQLDQLQAYAGETQGRWGIRADAILQPEVMYHHYQFMGRLDAAIGMQQGVIKDHDQRVERARLALLEAEVRLSSLKSVLEKLHRDQAQIQLRRDQKQTDERAALQYRNASNGLSGQED